MHRVSVSTLFGEDVKRPNQTPGRTSGAIPLGEQQDRSKLLFFLTERSNGLWKLRLFADCIPLYEHILTIEKNPWFRLKTKLSLTECAVRCNMKERADLEIKNTIKCVRKIAGLELQDVTNLAEEYEYQKLYIRAILLYICAADVLKDNFLGNRKMSNINEYFVRVRNLAQSLKSNLDEAKSLTSIISADCLIDVLNEIRAADCRLEAYEEAACVNNVGIIYSISGKLREAQSQFLLARKLMEDEYPQKTSKYLVYGNLLSNLGRISLSFGYLTEAKTYFMKSVLAWNSAENFPNEAQRVAQISSTMSKVGFIERELNGK